jgi:hypothetical protein
MTDLVQGKAVVQLGPAPDDLTDYTCWISEFVINDTRSTVIKAPTFSSPAIEEKAAANGATVTMAFLAVPDATSGLWWELNRAKGTRTGELYFDVKWADAAVSATNPRRTGHLVVTALDTGAAGFTARRQAKVFPARDVSGPLSS